MNKTVMGLAFFLCFMTLTSFGAYQPKDNDACIRDPGEVGDIPIPFGVLNQRLELASGEYYLLEGEIVKTAGLYFFNVDTEIHPYLAGGMKDKKAVYPLVLPNEESAPSLNAKVRILVRAEGAIRYDRNRSGYVHLVYLHLVADPQYVKKNKRDADTHLQKRKKKK